MNKLKLTSVFLVLVLMIAFTSCNIPLLAPALPGRQTPGLYVNRAASSTNSATLNRHTFFKDPYLAALIDSALNNNQELNVTRQEIEIARNEARARRGEYLPFVGIGAAAGVEKVSRYTTAGAAEDISQIRPGRETPETVPNLLVGPYANWEVDIWHKLRNAQKAAVNRYLGTVEGKNFMVTNLVSEIAEAYYELLALDNELEVLKQNIQIQSNALEIVKVEKEATRVTELAVRRFEAQVLNTRSRQYAIEQEIVETENHINFLIGSYPQHIARNASVFSALVPDSLMTGVPSQLLENRPDVRQAEQNLAASRLDIKSARANFYPSLRITAAVGFNAYSPAYLFSAPQSLIYSLLGELTGPLVNRNAIKANYLSANARQLQALYNYQKTILNAYIEVANQVSNISNLDKSYKNKAKEVEALTRSVTISKDLFISARADYMEVLLTQRDALESRFQLLETKEKQLHAMVQMYRALGGGWN
ncbi:MAG: TolC family protein [Bacteroidota bacterium]